MTHNNTAETGISQRTGHSSLQLGKILSSNGAVIFLIAMVAVFSVMMPDTFATRANFSEILAMQAIPGILALAALLPLAAGEFDLSVGATLGITAICAIALSNAGIPDLVVLFSCIAIGAGIGAVNAVLVVGIGVNAFIATLGISTILAGLNLLITQSSLLTLDSTTFSQLTTVSVGGLPAVVLYLVVLAALMWFLMERTPFGRYLRATGMGREAARLSGVRTGRYLSISFIGAGVLAGVAGSLLASWSGSAPPTLGPEYMLPAYAAAFLGATAIKPGYFNVIGLIIGVLVLAVGSNGLVILGAETWVTNIFNGTALIVAVSASLLSRRRGRRA